MKLEIEFAWRLRHFANTTGRSWKPRAGDAKRLRSKVGWHLLTLGRRRPALPCQVTITRLAPRRYDSDNMVHAGKHVRDEIAEWLGVDDRHDDRVLYLYRQEFSREYRVRITFEDRKPGE